MWDKLEYFSFPFKINNTIGKELSFPLYLWAFESGEVQWRYKKPFLRVFWLENGLSMTLCEVQKHSLHVMCMEAAL